MPPKNKPENKVRQCCKPIDGFFGVMTLLNQDEMRRRWWERMDENEKYWPRLRCSTVIANDPIFKALKKDIDAKE